MSKIMYLSFQTMDQLFGVPVYLTREIMQEYHYTAVDKSPPQVAGLLNLRGQIVTVLNTDVMLGLEPKDEKQNPELLILKRNQELTAFEEKTTDDLVALEVDQIGDVYEIEESEVQPVPANIQGFDKRLLSGVIDQENGLMMVLNLEEVLK